MKELPCTSTCAGELAANAFPDIVFPRQNRCLLFCMSNLHVFNLHYFDIAVYCFWVIVVVVRLVKGDPVKLGRLFARYDPELRVWTAF
jgi:hypothetical protein